MISVVCFFYALRISMTTHLPLLPFFLKSHVQKFLVTVDQSSVLKRKIAILIVISWFVYGSSSCDGLYFLSHPTTPRLFFLFLSRFSSMESSTLQSGAATYTTWWIPSPSSRAQRRTEPNRARTRTRIEDTAGAVSIFCRSGVRERDRSSGRFHRGGRCRCCCRVYVDL